MSRHILFFLLALASCNSGTDPEKERKTIREMLEAERKAHFSRDVNMFVSEFSDSMISVNRGSIKFTPPDTMRRSIRKYFNAVRFVKWDDLAEPIIRFSEGGDLAYALVQKLVIVTYPDSTGKPLFDSTRYAWVSIYRKLKGQWKVEANVSTNK